MSAPGGVQCSKCYCFQPLDPHNDDLGDCHFDPPVVAHPGLGRWPLVDPHTGWCFKFRHQAELPLHLKGLPEKDWTDRARSSP